MIDDDENDKDSKDYEDQISDSVDEQERLGEIPQDIMGRKAELETERFAQECCQGDKDYEDYMAAQENGGDSIELPGGIWKAWAI